MLTHFEVRTPQGNLLTLYLEDDTSEFVVERIDGLDPVKATLVSSSFAAMDGSQYQSSRRENRNILLRLALEPDYSTTSVRDLRKLLSSFFMPKEQVGLRFYTTDDPPVDIWGRVEDFNSPLFVSEPKVDISILCFDPDFVETTPIELSGNTVSDSTETLIEYKGTIETGFVFELNLDRSLSEFTIYHRLPDDTIRTMEINASLEIGDVLRISTVVGSKGVTLTRGGVESSLLYALSPQSSWLELFPGNNYFRVYATGDEIPYELTYSVRHGGL